MLDILIINVPGTARREPFLAPAMLKACVKEAGFSCYTIDFNIQFYQKYEHHPLFTDIENYFINGFEIPDYELQTKIDEQVKLIVNQWADEILKINPRFLGVSVFTQYNRSATEKLCYAIREKSKDIKIVLGGQGLSSSGINGTNEFSKLLLKKKAIDYFIKSEAEISLVELLKGNDSYPGINSDTFDQIKNIDNFPAPDFDDYNFDAYESKFLMALGSRGCVKACTFCDVHEHWKYTYRDGKKLANELIHLAEKYQVYKFLFADSLINGSLKHFKAFIHELAEYNHTHTKKISWGGQYIVRSRTQENEEFWKMLADAGGHNLIIGVESGSEKVRQHMQKKFSNSDIDFVVEQLAKNNVPAVFLLMVGYPTETKEDFLQTVELGDRYNHVPKNILKFSVSDMVSINPGTPLYHNAESMNIIRDEKHYINWTNMDNPGLDINTRIDYVYQIKEHFTKLGYVVHAMTSLLDFYKKNISIYESRTKVKKIIYLKQKSNKN
jgi:radical SAM superfamily enzyme YgiQ (UPF0313 family)